MQQSWLKKAASWDADIAACRSLLASGSRSFHAASFLLPRSVREPASALYAFCRLADDAVDLGGNVEDSIAALSARLDRVYRGKPLDHPADRALAIVVDCFAIPRELPAALLDGLAWDASGRRYHDVAELQAYAARVAGTVGVMMALLMDVRAPSLLARAADLGVAMQLTNIARDVGEDARAGRLYLPLEWLHDEGIDADEWLAAPRFSEALARVIAGLLDCADRLYLRADAGIARLPAACRPGIAAARLLYAEIGHELGKSGLDSVSRRTVVPVSRKIGLVAAALTRTASRDWEAVVPCLEQARFLIEAVGPLAPIASREGTNLKWWDFRGQALFVLDLFERLERRRTTNGADEALKLIA